MIYISKIQIFTFNFLIDYQTLLFDKISYVKLNYCLNLLLTNLLSYFLNQTNTQPQFFIKVGC